MKLKSLWPVEFLCIAIIFHCVSSLPVQETPTSTPTISLPAVANITYGFPPFSSEMYFSGNNTIQMYFINSSQVTNEKKNTTFSANTSLVLPPGYVELSRNNKFITAYKFHSTKVTWNQARNTCQYVGGYLAYLDSAEEGRKFQEVMNHKNSEPVWMGMHDLFEEGDWVTVFGENVSKLEYVNWQEGEPNNEGEIGEHCATLGFDARMNDVPCNLLYTYFCKIRIQF